MSRNRVRATFSYNNYETTYDKDDIFYVKKVVGDFTLLIYGTFPRENLYKVFSICCDYKHGGTVSIDVNRCVRNLPLLLEKIETVAKLPYDDVYDGLLDIM